MPKAREILEEVYDLRLSNKAPYHAQIGLLDASGELSSLRSITKTLFRLCELVDAQEEEIQALKEGHASFTRAESHTNTGL